MRVVQGVWCFVRMDKIGTQIALDCRHVGACYTLCMVTFVSENFLSFAYLFWHSIPPMRLYMCVRVRACVRVCVCPVRHMCMYVQGFAGSELELHVYYFLVSAP